MEARGFANGAPERGEPAPTGHQTRLRRIGLSLQSADPPSPQMLTRNRVSVYTQFGPFLSTMRRVLRKARSAASKSWARLVAYIQRRVRRYRIHKSASAPTIESMAIVQKTMAGYALPLSQPLATDGSLPRIGLLVT